jgi:hypothetical protein
MVEHDDVNILTLHMGGRPPNRLPKWWPPSWGQKFQRRGTPRRRLAKVGKLERTGR